MSDGLETAEFPRVVDAYRRGDPVIIVDDHSRENEGDIAVATECITTEHLSFMMREARGLICTTITRELSQHLRLPLQVVNNNSRFNTAFAVSIDHREVAPRGVTASARAYTMQRLLEEGAQADEFVSPGSVFPLIANPAGVVERQGQTEGAFDLARIVGRKPSGVICEIMNSDGSMARGEGLERFADKHGLLITSVADIVRYRLGKEIFVRKVTESVLETDYGKFDVTVFQDDVSGKEHLALGYAHRPGSVRDEDSLLVRVHSECLTGDVFGSRRCDCAAQLHHSLKAVAEEGRGMVLYLRQEGRGIGLTNKLKAYELQDRGLDTVEANVELGFAPDERDFIVAARILATFGISSVRLLTNNPDKVATLEQHGIVVSERVAISVPFDPCRKSYLDTKREKMGHLL